MSKAAAKKERITTTELTGLTFPPSRVARHCGHALNASSDEAFIESLKKLEELKKKGGNEPVHPPRAKLNASKLEKKQHKLAMEAYQEKVKEYNNYASKEYRAASTTAEVVLHLRKLLALLTQEGKDKKSAKPSQQELANIELIKKVLADEPTPQRKTETAEEYRQRKTKLAEKPPGYKKLVGDTDLDDAEAIKARIAKLEADESVKLFLTHNDLSNERPRSSTPVYVVIAACAEEVISALIDLSLKNVTVADKNLHPEIIIQDPIKLETVELWSLVRDTPHMRALLSKQRRLAAYTAEHDKRMKAWKQQRKTDLAEAKRKDQLLKAEDWVKEHPFDMESFGDREVRAGHAVRVEPEGKRKDGADKKPRYYWKNLDSDTENEDPDFAHYVRLMCDARRDQLVTLGNAHLEDLKISKKFSLFLSDLVVDMTVAISRQLHIRLNPRGDHAKVVKTIKYELVVDVIDQILTFSNFALSESQTAFLERISNAAKMLKDHKSSRNPKTTVVVEEDSDNESPAAAASPAASPAAAASPAPAASPAKRVANGKPQAAPLEEDSSDSSDDETPVATKAVAKPPARTVARGTK